MRVRVERLQVENWRGIREADVVLGAGPVTWLLGRNGAGKSSLLDAFSFVADLVAMGAQARRGTERGAPEDGALIPFSALLRDPTRPFGFAVELRDEDTERRWRYELTLRARGEYLHVEREWLSTSTEVGWRSVLERDKNGARWLVGGTARGDGVWEPVLGVAHTPLVASASPEQPTARWMGDVLRGVWTLRLDPMLMRGGGAAHPPERGVERHGRNLWRWVAHRLRQDPALAGALEQTAGASGVLPGLRVDPSGELVFVDPETGERPMWQASDGTLVNLALAALATLLPVGVTVVLLDEPAAAVDRAAARENAASVLELAQLAQVIACTQTLEVVNDYSKASVVVVERRPDVGAVFTPLSKHDAARLPDAGGYRAGELTWAWWETAERGDG